MPLGVLIADPDPTLRTVYQALLARHGYAVETAADGLECVRRMGARTPAVLVLDVGLQWGGAAGVLAWLREEGLTAEVAVVLTAAADGLTDPTAGSGPPVVGFLPKPFLPAGLLAQIRRAAAVDPSECFVTRAALRTT